MSTRVSADLADLTAAELLAAFAGREATPSDALDALLKRIDLVEPAVGAIVSLDRERARRLAAAADARWRDGSARALEGVPFGAKDHLDVVGLPTRGDAGRADAPPSARSSVAVRRLEDAGAIAIAKVHIEERHGAPDIRDIPRNPWNLAHGVAGSSSGPAASVAAHEIPLALGSDGLGSIRLPSAFVGISGLKPTFGRVPLESVSLVSVVGPMARSALDLALALRVMAGYDTGDPDSARVRVPDYAAALEKPVRGLRIGVPTKHYFHEASTEVRAGITNALDVLEREGCVNTPITLRETNLLGILGALLLLVPRAAYPLKGDVAMVGAAAKVFTAMDYERALRARRVVQEDFARAFEKVDVIVMPTIAGTATRLADDLTVIDGEEHTYLSNGWANPVANITGLPSVAICSGFTHDGLPTSLQFVGRPHDEATILQLAHAIQRATDFHRRRPPILQDLTRPLPERQPVDVASWVATGFYTLRTSRRNDPDLHEWNERVAAAQRGTSPTDGIVELIRSSVAPLQAELARLPADEMERIGITSAMRWLEDEGRKRLGGDEA
jgi:aspartyl-tRNA(Asn)/glutamyl-tRNA(Gln) amidotransferase subunit A